MSGLAAWWCERAQQGKGPIWLTTDEYLQLRDALTSVRRFRPAIGQPLGQPLLMGRPVVLVDQFDTVAFTERDEMRR